MTANGRRPGQASGIELVLGRQERKGQIHFRHRADNNRPPWLSTSEILPPQEWNAFEGESMAPRYATVNRDSETYRHDSLTDR